MVLCTYRKREEAHKVFLVNSQIQKQWEKFKPEPLPFIRTMNERDMAELEEIKSLRFKPFINAENLQQKEIYQ